MTKSKWVRIYSLYAFIICCLRLAADAHAFNVPEKLEYNLTWAGIKAGSATLELINEGDSLKIISTAKSAKLISLIYTVDDRVESTLTKTASSQMIGYPVNYKIKIREGRYRRNKEFIFNQETGRVIYINHLRNEKQEFDIPPSIFDPLSSFYYFRTLNLEVGKPVYITVFDNKKIWNVEVRVLKKEQIDAPTGTVNTILIKPLMQSEGIFYRKGEIFIWLTDDEKRIPVKLQTKVAVGSITATLVGGKY